MHVLPTAHYRAGPHPAHRIACQVKVTTLDGTKHSYYTFASSTCAAVMDALDIFGICKVSVQAIRS